jgi:uncharacterized repeat protein (TIGR01451 family)
VPAVATVPAAPGDVLSCDLADLGIACAVNGVVVSVAADAFNAGATKVGLATWEPSAPSPARFDAITVTDLPAEAELVAGVANAPAAAVGGPLSWTVTVRNLGTVGAESVTITAPAPLLANALTASTAAGSCTVVGALACNLGTLPVGAVATVQVTAVAAAPGDSSLVVTAATTTLESHLADNVAIGTVSIAPPPPSGLRLRDDFERPAAASLGTAPTGQPWVTHHGGFGVASGQAAPTSAGYSMALVDGGGSTGIVTATVATPSDEFWLVLRAAGGGDYWRFGRRQSGPYQLELIAGNALASPVVSTLATVQPAAGDEVECRPGGTGLRCAVNGQQVVSTTDASHAAATGVGFASFGSTAARFDDLSVADLPAAPDLAVHVDDVDPVVVGGTLRWTVTVTNVGDASAPAPSLSAALAPQPAGVSATSDAGSCDVGDGSPECTLASIAAGASAQVVVEATAPAQPGSVTLSATASTSGDAGGGNDTAAETTQVTAEPPAGARVFDDFERPGSSSLGSAPTGQAWSQHHGAFAVSGGRAAPSVPGYSFALLDGSGASGVVSVDVPVVSPEFWLVVRATDSANYWRFGRAGGGAYQLQQITGNGLGSPTVTTVASAPAAAGDQLSCRYLDAAISCSVNGAPVASAAAGANPAASLVGIAVWDPAGVPGTRFDNLEVIDVPPVLDASVAVSDVDPVLVGGNLRWTVAVANAGTVTATGVAVDATLPPGIGGVAVVASQGTCQVTATISCAVGSLGTGAAAEIVVTATAPPDPGVLSLTATVSVDGDDAHPGNDADQESTTVRLPPPPGSRVIDGFGGSGALVATETGEVWTVESGGFSMAGGELAPASAQPSVAAVDTGSAFGTYELTVSEIGDRRFWLAFRIVDSANYFRVGPDQAGFYRLEKVVNGQVQPVAISINRANVTAADGDVIRLVTRPDDGMFVAVNGIHVVDAGDVQSMSVSRFGIAAASSSVRFDHLDIGQVATASVLITDTFTRPDGTPMGRVESGVSYDWWSRGGGEWGIDAGRAYATGSGYTIVGADTASESADFRATVARTADEFALVFRYDEDDSYYRFGRLHAGEGYDIDLIDGWSSSPPPVPVERLAAPVPADGDVLEVRQFLDGRIECLVDGTVVLRLTDTATNPRGTIYGFATTGSVARFDDVTIVPE